MTGEQKFVAIILCALIASFTTCSATEIATKGYIIKITNTGCEP